MKDATAADAVAAAPTAEALYPIYSYYIVDQKCMLKCLGIRPYPYDPIELTPNGPVSDLRTESDLTAADVSGSDYLN